MVIERDCMDHQVRVAENGSNRGVMILNMIQVLNHLVSLGRRLRMKKRSGGAKAD